jgi:hypothetical protein
MSLQGYVSKKKWHAEYEFITLTNEIHTVYVQSTDSYIQELFQLFITFGKLSVLILETQSLNPTKCILLCIKSIKPAPFTNDMSVRWFNKIIDDDSVNNMSCIHIDFQIWKNIPVTIELFQIHPELPSDITSIRSLYTCMLKLDLYCLKMYLKSIDKLKHYFRIVLIQTMLTISISNKTIWLSTELMKCLCIYIPDKVIYTSTLEWLMNHEYVDMKKKGEHVFIGLTCLLNKRRLAKNAIIIHQANAGPKYIQKGIVNYTCDVNCNVEFIIRNLNKLPASFASKENVLCNSTLNDYVTEEMEYESFVIWFDEHYLKKIIFLCNVVHKNASRYHHIAVNDLSNTAERIEFSEHHTIKFANQIFPNMESFARLQSTKFIGNVQSNLTILFNEQGEPVKNIDVICMHESQCTLELASTARFISKQLIIVKSIRVT